MSSNCSNLLDMRNLQEQVKKAFWILIPYFVLFSELIDDYPSDKRSRTRAKYEDVMKLFRNLAMSRLMKRSQKTKRSGESAEGIGNRKINCIEVAQGDIFMEQKMRFGLVLGCWQYWNKYFGSIMSNFWGQFFHVFIAKK